MRFPIGCLLSTLSAVALAATPASAIISTFDTDLDGWTPVGLDIEFVLLPMPDITAINFVQNTPDMVHESSGGNLGGYARLTDAIEEPASFALAPGKFLGDLSGFIGGTFSFDHKIFDDGTPNSGIAPYSIIITSGDPADLNSLIWTAPAPPDPPGTTDWVEFDIPINEQNFGLLQDTPLSVIDPSLPNLTPAFFGLMGTLNFQQILMNVSSILVAFELVDNDGFQNQEWAGIDNVEIVPEPNTAALLALGLLGLARRGRSQRRH